MSRQNLKHTKRTRKTHPDGMSIDPRPHQHLPAQHAVPKLGPVQHGVVAIIRLPGYHPPVTGSVVRATETRNNPATCGQTDKDAL